MRLRRLSSWLSDRSGIAAAEFALIIGPLMLFMMATFEITLRLQAADEFERYAFQVGDVMSRDDGLTKSDVDVLYQAADMMMQHVEVEDEKLDLDVASIGFQAGGDPVLLWRRYRGGKPFDLDLSQAEGLAEPGETVLRVSVTLRYNTPLDFLPDNPDGMSRFAFFKPRTTRAISMDGQVADPGVDWDFYSAGS